MQWIMCILGTDSTRTCTMLQCIIQCIVEWNPILIQLMNPIAIAMVVIVSRAVTQVLRSRLPPGPSSLEELFRWPSFNTQRLFYDHPNAAMHRENLARLARRGVLLNDSYSGMGTAGTTLHLQYDIAARRVLGSMVALMSSFSSPSPTEIR